MSAAMARVGELLAPVRRGGVARGYAAVAAAATCFLVLGLVVQPVTRPVERSLGAPVAAGGLPTGGADPGAGQAASVVAQPGAAVQAGAGSSGGSSRGPAVTAAAGPVGGVRACPDRAKQVPGDPYSPPCTAFSGSNGGATSRGVTADTITVSVRELSGPTAAQLFAQLSGQQVIDSREAYENTMRALADYFNSRFQLYGRKIKLVFYKGQGNGSTELLGGGGPQALADSVVSAKQIGAFADLSGITLPYADALSQQGVVNIGAPYPSAAWFDQRQPYAWSLFPDGTNVVTSSASEIISRLGRSSTAQYGGAAVNGKPRKYATLAPENVEYQQSVNQYIASLKASGIDVALNIKYKLDISSMPNQASNIIAQLKDAGVTTVLCGCDPVMLALGLTPKANEQDYQPEWATSGLAFVDQDIVSQLIDQKQWAHAFGIAYNAESEPQGRSYPYAAYKSQRPNDEPAFGVEELYYQMYLLAIGLQLAGPNLTPATYQAGMYAYPGGSGPRGSWHFGPHDHTPTDDFREIWWDPNQVSGQNDRPGAWIQLDGGRRYKAGQVPNGPAPFFRR